jgi:hypothetical protein
LRARYSIFPPALPAYAIHLRWHGVLYHRSPRLILNIGNTDSENVLTGESKTIVECLIGSR